MTDPAIVIFCHVHYPDIWESIAGRIEQVMDRPFRLVLTTSALGPSLKRPETPLLMSIRVMRIDNRGRDILPFLMALREQETFDIGLKIHTKRSLHRLDGDRWRESLLNSLLPSRSEVSQLIAAWSLHRDIGIVAPSNALCSISHWMTGNQRPVRRVLHRLGVSEEQSQAMHSSFVAGSMFWFRRSALQAFADQKLDDGFEIEVGRTNGTTAHAIERLFSVVAATGGQETMTMAALLAGGEGASLNEMRRMTMEAVDRDIEFLRPPSPQVAWLAAHLPWLINAYAAMPNPVRRTLRYLARVALRSGSRNESRTAKSDDRKTNA